MTPILPPTVTVTELTVEVRNALREPFPREQIGKLPATAKRPALDFVGHAAVTDRLNRVAPDWTYTIDEVTAVEGRCWIRGTLTIGGVSRPEYGDGDDPKEAIGNFIRRAAMRFGVAIDLWSREELQSSGDGTVARPLRSSAQSSPGSTSGGRLQGPSVDPAEGDSGIASRPTSVSAEETGEGSRRDRREGGDSREGLSPPSDCDHHYPTGVPAKVIKGGEEFCRLCGESWVSVMEGTTEDLGSA